MTSQTILRNGVSLLLAVLGIACTQIVERNVRSCEVRTVTMRIRPFVVPREAVTRNAYGKPVAWVVGRTDAVEERVLETGPAVAGRMVVTRGLSIGDRVIVEKGTDVRPGVLVTASDPADVEARNVIVCRLSYLCSTLEREIRRVYRVP